MNNMKDGLVMTFIVETENNDCRFLQRAASKVYPELKDTKKFIEWVTEYMRGSFGELVEKFVDE